MSSPSTVISFSFGTMISESTNSAQRVNALLRQLHALALMLKRLGHHRHGEDTLFLGDLGHHRRRAGAGAAAHAGGDEHHVHAFQQFGDALAVFLGGGMADIRPGTRPQPLGQVAADLQLVARLVAAERLRVGVDGDKLHALTICSIMWLSALPPQPPTPMTLITAP